ncbi:MAG: rhodanese-like domain-containing protein [Winogradskyella sp.]|uniref:rhodanese-like domain-containing protein n=1 Tax=Winogradskyella sp. TaxID=1883156 RepID=UPI0038590B03
MNALKTLSIIIIFIGSMTFGFAQKQKVITLDKINYNGFVALSDSLKTYRETRLIDEATFNNYSKQPHTIILDTRSKKAYDDIHIKGAIHLNFSDFTEEKLNNIIPDRTTRILIYCNNNFDSKKRSLLNKYRRLALNIPTFINLYGYGYKNIYELKGYLNELETQIPLQTNSKK